MFILVLQVIFDLSPFRLMTVPTYDGLGKSDLRPSLNHMIIIQSLNNRLIFTTVAVSRDCNL